MSGFKSGGPVLGERTGTPEPATSPLAVSQFRLLVNLPAQTQAQADAGIDVAQLLLDSASALVEAYARCAPQAIKNSAIVRVASWIATSSTNDTVLTRLGDNLGFAWRPTVSRNAMRSSGATGLLAPWHMPRATLLEEST